jgi:uncharacterized phage protein (TIGR01671 family)
MDREIKFRAWEVFDENMIYHNSINYEYCIANHGCEVILMQYIGLKDKNGKEIYEGDIVEQWGQKRTVVYMVGSFGYIVNEDEDYAEFISFAANQHYDWIADKSDEIEIIGNIYETPHLLNKDQNAQVSDTTENINENGYHKRRGKGYKE